MAKKASPVVAVAGSCPIPLDAPFTVLIDTREPFAQAWDFGLEIPTEHIKLEEGDYTIKGFEGVVGVERKELNDFTKSIVLDRFWDEIKRTLEKNYKSFIVVVEGSMSNILEHRYNSQLKPSSVLGAINSLAVKCQIPVILCDTRAQASHYALTYLKYCWDRRYKGVFWPNAETTTPP